MVLIHHNVKEKIIFACQILLAKYLNGSKGLKKQSFKQILCIKQDEIGDLCYSLHVFDLLKEKYPQAKITLLCQTYCNSLVQNHPAIYKTANSFKNLPKHFDLIVDLRGSWKSIWFSLKNKPKVYLERGSVRLKNKKTGHPHEVFTNLQILEPLIGKVLVEPKPRLYIADENTQKAKQFITENNIKQFAIIHPSARKPLKKWNPKRFAELATWLKHSKNLDIVFAGDNTEVIHLENIQRELIFKTYSIAGNLNLTDFAALVNLANLYVGNDSGPLSIANISNTPSLGLFGPGVPTVFYPYGPKTDYIHYVLACNPCDQYHCKHPDFNCMDRITLLEVQQKIENLMA